MSSTIFFFFFIPLLSVILLAVNIILAPRNPYMEKSGVFECGFTSFLGQNRTQFSISFFIFALLFLLFDLEILLVYPYLVSAYVNEAYGLSILMIFLGALTIGFVFELGKKALTIDSRQTGYASKKEVTPQSNTIIPYNNHINNMVNVKSGVLPIKTIAFFNKYNTRNSLKFTLMLNNGQKRGLCTTKPLRGLGVREKLADEVASADHLRFLSYLGRCMTGNPVPPLREAKDTALDNVRVLDRNKLIDDKLGHIRTNPLWAEVNANNKPEVYSPHKAVDTDHNTDQQLGTKRLPEMAHAHRGHATFMDKPMDIHNKNRDMNGNLIGPPLDPTHPAVVDPAMVSDKQAKCQLDVDPGIGVIRSTKRKLDEAFVKSCENTYSNKKSFMSLPDDTRVNSLVENNSPGGTSELCFAPLALLTEGIGEANPLLRLTALLISHIYKCRHFMPSCLDSNVIRLNIA